jgi:hypothetical protein
MSRATKIVLATLGVSVVLSLVLVVQLTFTTLG